MIPDTPLTINITSIDTDDRNEVRNGIEKARYDGESAFGFQIEELSESTISARLITTNSTQISTVDTETGEITSETIVEADEIPFIINFSSGVLEVFDNKDSNGEVLNRLGQASRSFVTTEVTVDLAELLEKLDQSELDVSTSAVRINNYSPEPNTNGNCYLNIFDENTAKKIIGEYGEDISYVSVELSNGDEADTDTIGCYRSGSIRVFSKLEEPHRLQQLREIIHGVI